LLQRRDDKRLDDSLLDKLVRQGMTVNTVELAGFRTRLQSSGFYGRWRDAWGPAAWKVLEKYSGQLT
jgi:hypothetical protein